MLHTSYRASEHAQHLSFNIDSVSTVCGSSSQNSRLNGPSSIYQMSRCSTTVARNITQPVPGGGAVHIILCKENVMHWIIYNMECEMKL